MIVQIRQRRTATAGALDLTVESDADGWKAVVADHDHVLYSARRASAAAAQSVAVEYAEFLTAHAVAPQWRVSW